MKSSIQRNADFVRVTDDIAKNIGYDFDAFIIAPLNMALVASDFIRILLDEIFFTVITILSVLAVILIFSLLLADTEEKTFEYGLLRCLGITHQSIMKLLATQALSFSMAGILSGLLVAFWI